MLFHACEIMKTKSQISLNHIFDYSTMRCTYFSVWHFLFQALGHFNRPNHLSPAYLCNGLSVLAAKAQCAILYSLSYPMIHRMQNKLSPLNNHMIKELSWVVTIVACHAQHCLLAVTCLVTLDPIKTMVIAGYLPCQVKQNQFQGFVI